MKTWPAEVLDEMRLRADPPADDVIAQLAANGQTRAVSGLMKALMYNEDVPSEALPSFLTDFLRKSAEAVTSADVGRMRVAEGLFELYGPEILMILGVYALPEAYASRKGVQVLHRSGYLENRPMRRVWETTQFLVDVMSGGGLEPGGMGMRTAQKVRLMHAAIRHLVQNNPERPWQTAELGLPINQEDLAGTLMAFSCVVLEGLRRLGVEIAPEEQEAYLYAWRTVGMVLGVDPFLIPADMDEAWTLARTITARQVEASTEGQDLALALVEGLQGLMPLAVGFVPSAMRFFLEDDAISGQNVADILAIPAANWTKDLIRISGLATRIGGEVADLDSVVAAALRRIRMGYVDMLLLCQRGPGRPSFRIPQRLQDLWRGV